ncbi:MAG: hypothetical protein COY22_02580 [Candidatus Tagabacteria bacterium CG_4_10_14_0_2_um_filter_40_13]|uniref:PD-(D/E)XK endonuclease-like domain-containing protein n=2 Tax=Candidatus Tagaibacteriota TaxID=1817918 RepID=A0A2M7B9P3_9BACT|nr:MAG: hypothetical protein COV90_00990 [Candidatus Tagabacteria bacterium CG11_big_fil_rev_8_21_14_0_20_41_11]PIU99835.1 MAG: hypothetical protein COS58_00265 [Candidatus Tagabacteria bacterium CG03_land_8_20_14_0_80_41_22]PIZ56049.1 MAG: hypothetical protein COY22_02580 [Candidatus Tagabacteria bacterium CG_4_10_14_0_2_um_filter_40_13]PJC25222.1 MAG: hypothetical protein CO056_01265 [Candidatus Tagabacteria bacterium CG_4_9_14_0_2_um_filter_41_11]
MRTSYSALTTYQQCPLRFKFQEIDRIRVPKGLEAVFGAMIHNCLKFMFERTPLYPTLDEVIDRFRTIWQNKEITNLNFEEDKAYCEDGISLLKNFYRLNQPWNFNALELESRFEVLVSEQENEEKHVLTGIIDRIDKISNTDIFEIIDYKTSRRMPSQENLDKDLQMSIYHLGISRRWPHIKPENIKLSLYFLKHGEKITTSRSKEDLEKTKDFVIELINEIKKRIENNYDFPPHPSPLCDWCGYRPRCPMWKHLYQSKAKEIPGQKEIEKIIKEYFDLKSQNQKNSKRLTELQSSIYEFMAHENVERVFGENCYLTKTLQERFIYDMKKIKEILEEIGKWDEVAKKKQFSILKATKKKPGA